MISDLWTWIFGFLQSVGGAATAGALVFVGMQTLLMRRQMNSSFRPWLGVYQEGLVEQSSNQLLLRVTNYGSLPSTSLRILWKDSQGTINRNDIKSLDTFHDHEVNAIFPNQIWEKTLPIEGSLLDSAKKGETSLFIAVLINYKYANNRSGEYGIIFQYGTILPKFVVHQVWAT